MPSYTVHTGFWIDWERGAIDGATITLTPRDSQVLSSFLSALLTFVGLQLWKIGAFTVHQARATDKIVDGLHRQQQLVWKQYGGPAASAWAFAKQSWAWRAHARRPFFRTLPLAIISALYAVGFTVIAIFAASEITRSTGSLRLIEPGNCGYYNLTDTASDTVAHQISANIKTTKDFKAAISYAESCYPSSQNLTSATRCDLYRKPHINYTMTTIDQCPYPASFCTAWGLPLRPIVLDTGMTDSANDWGINAPEHERVQMRRVTTCSPLSSRNHSEVRNTTRPTGGNDLHQYALFGPTSSGVSSYNYTFDYNTNAALTESGYTVSALSWTASYKGENVWQPIAEMRRDDADVNMFFIASNGVESTYPIEDTVFNMSLPQGSYINPITKQNGTFYTSNQYYVALSCIDQVDFCNPQNGQCAGLSSHGAVIEKYGKLGLSVVQYETVTRLYWSLPASQITAPIVNGGSSALRASDTLIDGTLQQDLPNDQWARECTGWFETALARMQQVVLEYATGPLNIDGGGLVTTFGRPEAEKQCKRQLINLNDGSVSYSVLGLALTVGLSCVIIIISYSLETVVGLVQRLMRRGEHRRRAWVLDSGFQLHRQVCEQQGFGGTWYNHDGEVPVCDRDGKFGSDGQATLEELKTPQGQPEASPFIPVGAQAGQTAYDPASYARAGAYGEHGVEYKTGAHASVQSHHSPYQ